jgi:ubiquitin carboxyl-terminal hydrolase 1
MVVHYGSHHFGHYVAFRRRPEPPPDLADEVKIPRSVSSPEWYRISDETVDVSTLDEALRNNPFLLFYERVQDPLRHVEGTRRKAEEREEGAEEDSGRGRNLEELLKEGLRPRVVESWRLRSNGETRGKREVPMGDETF